MVSGLKARDTGRPHPCWGRGRLRGYGGGKGQDALRQGPGKQASFDRLRTGLPYPLK